MRKFLIALALLILIGGGLFMWLLSGTSPDNADTTEDIRNIPTKFIESD